MQIDQPLLKRLLISLHFAARPGMRTGPEDMNALLREMREALGIGDDVLFYQEGN